MELVLSVQLFHWKKAEFSNEAEWLWFVWQRPEMERYIVVPSVHWANILLVKCKIDWSNQAFGVHVHMYEHRRHFSNRVITWNLSSHKILD